MLQGAEVVGLTLQSRVIVKERKDVGVQELVINGWIRKGLVFGQAAQEVGSGAFICCFVKAPCCAAAHCHFLTALRLSLFRQNYAGDRTCFEPAAATVLALDISTPLKRVMSYWTDTDTLISSAHFGDMSA